jgi:uncharacterized protein (TIGR02145 family)
VTYEGETYQTVVIGTQTWMSRNLNYAVEGSKCYSDNESNCATYGRLYNWATAMALPSKCNSNSCSSEIGAKHRGICPVGWHIPSEAEWTTLTDYVGGLSIAGKRLKSTSGWSSNGNGEDKHGFAALPGGSGRSGSFSNVGNSGYWWSSFESGANGTYDRGMKYNHDHVSWSNYNNKSYLYSVRCLQN